MKDKKELIKNILKKGELSTSKIANEISANIYRTEELLNELKKEGIVQNKLTKNGVYWRLK
jgi:predicted transcriptional regulator